MLPLKVRFLGYPEITAGGQALSFRTRKVLALLVYLVVEGGLHSRAALMALLWPESPPEKAAVTLRGTLSRLRKSLQPAGGILRTESGQVGVDFEGPIDLDLAWLADAVQPETSPGSLAPILDLDRDEFLAGFSLPDAPDFDTWAAIQREACQRQVETVYDRLSQHQLADHDSLSAVDTAARWVARAPLSEVAYRRLMAANALAGDRPAALKTFDQCMAVLQAEFGIEPARETVVLADHIRRDRVLEEPGRSPAARTGSPIAPSPPAGRGPGLPLVGRAAEHSQLAAAFHQVRAGGAQVVALIGAAGVGKTRLVSAFGEWAVLEAPGVEIWDGRAFEAGGRLPYQPVIEALRIRLDLENAPEDLLEDVWLAELSQLIPELRARYPDLPPPMTGEADFVRARLFEAVVALGSALAGRHPAIFILDDLQWADPGTREIVHYTARRWAESGRAHSAAAGRAPGVLRRGPGLAGMARAARSGFLLDPPAPGYAGRERRAEACRPASRSGGRRPVNKRIRDLALVRDPRAAVFYRGPAADAGRTGDGDPHPGPGPPHLRFQDRPGRCPILFPSAAAAGCARGHPGPPGTAPRAGGRAAAGRGGARAGLQFCTPVPGGRPPGGEGLVALEALLNASLMSERSAAREPYTLAHDYIRLVVYSESREARRRVFHRRALLALEAVRAPAAECAYHALASLLDEPAFRYSLAAGDEAYRSYALQECLAHYDQAQDAAWRMIAAGAPIASSALVQLYRNRGLALELLQNTEAARDNYQEMLALAAERGDPHLELAALTAQCMIHATYTSVFNPPLAMDLGQAALELSRKLADRAAEAGALLGLMLAALFSGGESRQTAAYGEGSLALARELGLKEQMGVVLNNLCWPYIAQKRLEAARQANQEAQAFWRELGDLPMLAEAYTMGCFILFFTGEHEGLLAAASEARQLSRSIGSRLHEGNALRFMAGVHLIQGRFADALADINAAVTLSEETGHIYSQQTDYRYLISFFRTAGASDQAAQWADRLYEMRESIMPTFRTYFLTDVARAKIAHGKLQEGQAILDGLLEGFAWEASWSHTIIPIWIARAHLQLALGDPQGVFGDLDEKVEGFREAGFLYELAEELCLRGRAWLSLGENERARETLLKARAVAEEKGERIILWQVLAALSELERKSGREMEAQELQGQVQELVHAIAAQAGSPELQASFLAQPQVRRVFEEG